MNILFSIIVPIYKIESYLRECIDSLITQTYSNIEIILVDDGSPDNCPFICDEYAAKDKRIHVIHKKNGGLVSARKSGAELAQGEYILCVDGDDYVAPNYVETFALHAFESHPDIILTQGFLTSNTTNTTTSSENTSKYYNYNDIRKNIYPKIIRALDGSALTFSICSHAIKRELYLHYQQLVDSNIKVGEDIACINPIICHAKSLCTISDRLYYYRINTESMTHGGQVGSWNDPKLISEHLKKYTSDVNYDFTEAINRETAYHIFNVAVSQFYRNEPYSIIRSTILSELNEPVFIEAKNNAKFLGSYKAKFIMWALEDSSCFLFWIYSRIKIKKRAFNVFRHLIKSIFHVTI